MLLFLISLNKYYIMKYNILMLMMLSLSNLNAQESNKKSPVYHPQRIFVTELNMLKFCIQMI